MKHFTRVSGAVIAALALFLTGCSDDAGSSAGSTANEAPSQDAGSESSKPVSAEKRSDDDWWEASLCSQLDLDDLAASIGLESLERQLGNGFDIGVPSVRTCEVGEGSGPASTGLQYGVSVAPVTDEVWANAEAQLGVIAGDPAAVQPLEVGDAAFALPSLAMSRVGDQLVSVDTSDDDALTPDHMQAALEAGVDALDSVAVEPQQVIDECSAADAEAEALLGAKPTTRLDFYHPTFSVPNCVWATDTAAIKVFAITYEDPAGSLADQGFDVTADIGLGGGMYLEGESVFVLGWVSPDNTYDVTVEFVEGQQVSQDAALKLGKALENLYP